MRAACSSTCRSGWFSRGLVPEEQSTKLPGGSSSLASSPPRAAASSTCRYCSAPQSACFRVWNWKVVRHPKQRLPKAQLFRMLVLEEESPQLSGGAQRHNGLASSTPRAARSSICRHSCAMQGVCFEV